MAAISKQYRANVERSLARLRDASAALPLVVTFDWERREFLVSFERAPSRVLTRGRFQIAAEWIEGFRTGFLEAGRAFAVEVLAREGER